MAIQRANSFTSYELTEQEKAEAVKLAHFQILYLQTLHADTAEMLLGLVFTPNDVLKYAQEEAYLRGQLEIINFLLKQDVSAKLERQREFKDENPSSTT
jgi:hypothetical protein